LAILPEEKLRNSTFLGKWRQRNLHSICISKKNKSEKSKTKKKFGEFLGNFSENFGSDEKIRMDKN
jgi:hypothetical protein